MLLAFPEAAAHGAAGDAPDTASSGTSPLLREASAVREAARREGTLIYYRSCRPCHGMLGAGDGPYAATFGAAPPSLLREAREPSPTFDRIKRGTGDKESRTGAIAMPGFGDILSDRQIWSVLLVIDDARTLVRSSAASAGAPTLYDTRCAACHGVKGAGDGPLAAELFPRPRDFRKAAYRFRSTSSGAVPRPDDLVRTLDHGLGDTAMGSFAPLGARAIARLAEYLKSFAPERFATEASIAAPKPAAMPEDGTLLARGRALYEDLSCNQCHGKDGRGDGPTDLKDDGANVSRPANLTKRWQLKGGASADDLFRSITTGLNGTPMPSYAEVVEPADRWALSRYVESLGRARPIALVELRATPTASIPDDPSAVFWEQLTRAGVPLGPQMTSEPRWTVPSIDMIEIAVAVSARQVGFLLAWDDRSRDVVNEDVNVARDATIDARLVGHWRLADQVALEFPAGRWMWSAEGGASNAAVRVERIAAPVPLPESAPADAPRVRRVGLFGDKRAGGGDAVRVSARATFAFGRWRLLMIADRLPSDTSLVGFEAGSRMPFSLRAWDGGAGETGARHAVSSSITLVLPD